MSFSLQRLDASRTAEHVEFIVSALGNVPNPEGVRRWSLFPELVLRLALFDGATFVGSLGGLHFDMTVPGGAFVPTLGLTLVAVRPTHRRRGIMRALVTEALADAHKEGRPLAALFASEAGLYGRFGFGLASHAAEVAIDRHRSAFRADVQRTPGAPRALDQAGALELFPRIWDAARRARPGMLSRSEPWWRLRRIDEPEWRRKGRGLLQFAVFEEHGAPASYAIWRHGQGFDHGLPTADHEAFEIMGVSPSSLLAAWRFVLDTDLGARVLGALLPADHPLTFALADPAALRLKTAPALFVRLVDVQAALSLRSLHGTRSLVVEVADALCPWNQGRFRLSPGGPSRGPVDRQVERTDAAPALSLDVEALGALYLGGFSAVALAQAGRIHCSDDEAPHRLDELLGRHPAPWCPEMF